jgi:hypothetical protein
MDSLKVAVIVNVAPLLTGLLVEYVMEAVGAVVSVYPAAVDSLVGLTFVAVLLKLSAPVRVMFSKVFPTAAESVVMVLVYL